MKAEQVWFNHGMDLRAALRGTLYQTEKLTQRLRFASLSAPEAGWPILLGISFPKSGTHLLDQILTGFAGFAPFAQRVHSFYAEYEGESGQKRTPEQAAAWLDSLRPLDTASAHLFARPEAVTRVTSGKFVPYFIFRDPRDVVVSHVFYVTEMEPAHVHHQHYNRLKTFGERLRTSILGIPDSEVEFPNIAERFAPYLGWLNCSAVLTVRFEELVNERAATLNLIIDHFLARVPLAVPRQKIFDALESSINPAKSPTYRSGKTGEWKNHFTDDDKKIFKDVAGDLLVRLGYEVDNDW